MDEVSVTSAELYFFGLLLCRLKAENPEALALMMESGVDSCVETIVQVAEGNR